MTMQESQPERPVLVVVDVAQSVVSNLRDGTVDDGPAILDNLKALVRTAETASVPVIYTIGGKRWHTALESELTPAERGSWVWKHGYSEPSARESVLAHARFDPDFAPSASATVIEKHRPSAFFGTALASMVNAADGNQVIVAGVMTSGCVRASIVDAFSYDLRPLLVMDAVGDVNRKWHDSAMEELPAKYCQTASTGDVVERLKG